MGSSFYFFPQPRELRQGGILLRQPSKQVDRQAAAGGQIAYIYAVILPQGKAFVLKTPGFDIVCPSPVCRRSEAFSFAFRQGQPIRHAEDCRPVERR